MHDKKTVSVRVVETADARPRWQRRADIVFKALVAMGAIAGVGSFLLKLAEVLIIKH